MIETNIEKLNIEEFIQKIKDEVEKRKNGIKNIQSTKENKQYKFKIQYKSIIQKKEIPFIQKKIYEYPDFTKYHDIEFIQNVYRGLLTREADNEGLNHYLELLRNGTKSKSELISFIRYSKEGRKQNIPLLGSKERFLIAFIYNIPFVGYIAKSFVVLITLPRLLKKLNALDNYISQEAMFSHHNDLLLEKKINKKVDTLKIQNYIEKLNQKTDKIEFQNIKNILIDIKERL